MPTPIRSLLLLPMLLLLYSSSVKEAAAQQAFPAVNPANPINPTYFSGPNRFGFNFGYSRGYIYPGFGYPAFGYGGPIYQGPNFYNFQTVYPYGFNGHYGPYSIYGPLVLPTDSVFGVNALPAMARPQFRANPRPQVNIIVAPQAINRPADPGPNAESIQRANQQITFGDNEFHQRNFLAAYKHYQNARKLALGYAEAEFRLGWVLLALRKFDRAADAFAQGLKLNPDWVESDFSLETLFPEEGRAQAKLNQLVAMAEENPRDAHVMLGLGIFLHFHGEPAKAQLVFQEVAQLDPGNPVAAAFLKVGGAREF